MKTNLPSKFLYSCAQVELHYKRPLFNSMQHIKNSNDVDTLLRKFIALNRIDLKEFFWVILMTNANRVIGISEIGSGTPRGVSTNFHEIYQLILKTNATAFAVAHNHPSGNMKPSENDKRITKKIQKLSKLMNVEFVDHLIITSEDYFSFNDMHLL